MKTLAIILISLSNFLTVSSQEIEIIKKADSIPIIKEKGLFYINPETDLTDFYFIAEIKITSNDFNDILRSLQKTSIKLSANAFKFIESENLQNRTSVNIELFSAVPKLIEINQSNNESNVIYFFGNDIKTQKFKIGRSKIELKPNEIYKYKLKKNEEVKINKGGFTGMTVFHNWRKNQPSIFYAFGSGNLSTYGNGNSSIGLMISTGNIIELKSDFAYLLMDLKN